MTSPIGEQTARVLKRHMERGNIRQVDLAAATGVSRKAVSDWLKGMLANPLKQEHVLVLAERVFRLQGEEKREFLVDMGYPDAILESPSTSLAVRQCRVVVLYSALEVRDKQYATALANLLKTQANYQVELLHQLDKIPSLTRADWIVFCLSPYSVYSAQLLDLLDSAYQIAQKNCSLLVGVSAKKLEDVPQEVSNLLSNIQVLDIENVRKELEEAFGSLLQQLSEKYHRPYELEMVTGAIPLDSAFYVERLCDESFKSCFERGDSALLIKGARQVGKTSLLARGIDMARRMGYHVLLVDFQRFSQHDLHSLKDFFIAFAELLADQLRLDIYPREVWREGRSASVNFDLYIRDYVLQPLQQRVLLAIDEADRILAHSFSDDVFSLFRSWHNDRSLRPDSPCHRLTIALAYSTEPYLFIKDITQSPFNIGSKIPVEDFDLAQLSVLNQHYGSILYRGELEEFLEFTGGQPYLSRCILNDMVIRKLSYYDFLLYIKNHDTALSDHLKRIVYLLSQETGHELQAAIKEFIKTGKVESQRLFSRLRSAGIIAGSVEYPRFRCRLYKDYLTAHFA
ncbi:AAA-like domain-containing protein [Thioflexithrix psekupsensis]|uniref:Uncharacterized protein n=1 Tax=Thioflexithrix psekupsensis TaxID=1570016 RepID=A0A251XBB8_9GAMM|nr:AAA-like domain-containing protein [Thioflexithrix psekupsensis]OUD15659.1 hypothetical protein TPSD3_03830 [Thioflexithrix psekupsensis]